MKKLYCSTCKKYVDHESYDFISGACRKCLSRELKKGKIRIADVPDDDEEDEETAVLDDEPVLDDESDDGG